MHIIETQKTNDRWMDSDERFNGLYPQHIQALAQRHFTPLHVAREAAHFLAVDGDVKILDIGSGTGKFCLSAASFEKSASFYGVEQRKSLIDMSEDAKMRLNLTNVHFIHGNFTELDLTDYDHFYFYNSFYENLEGTVKIDNTVNYSEDLYNYYNRYFFKQLALKPAGTRLATYYSLEDEMPIGYHIVGTSLDYRLKFWVKI